MYSRREKQMNTQPFINLPTYYTCPKDMKTSHFSQMRSMTKNAWIFDVLKKIN